MGSGHTLRRAAGYDRKTLVARLNGAFRLAGAPSVQGALQFIQQESRLAAAEITNNISGLSVPRDTSVQAVVEAAKSPGGTCPASLRQPCTMLALMPWDRATLATDAPGASHSAMIWSFSSRA